MDKTRFELGLTKRKATLGAEYVEKTYRQPMILTVRFKKP